MVAGLEVHVELSTASKIFCGCVTDFGGEPNTHVCPVCTGMPGTLPVLNRTVVEFAVRTGLALRCDITRRGKFDRKNYFYPDLPKAYQVSQLYLPVCRDGALDIGGGKTIGIHEIHMEEDAGKLIHDPWEDCTLVDFNRCGVPLLEIVSEPDFRSAGEVIAYLEKLREILLYLGVSDCKMQEGSMRADINLSVRPEGQAELGTRTEMKNMNSFKAIARAVESETKRQIEVLRAGGQIRQETRRWDDNKDASFAMRSKENAQDYRYFPEPDLLPVHIDDAWIERIRRETPELAEDKRRRYRADFGLPEYDARQLTSERAWARLFEETAARTGRPKAAANLIMTDIMRMTGDSGLLPEELTLDPAKLAALIGLIEGGQINRTVGKKVLEQVFFHDVDPEAYVKAQGLLLVGDPDLVRAAVETVLADNPKSVEDYRGGKEKAFGFLVGQTMRALGGKADPQLIHRLVREALTGRGLVD
ncbi:MAG: Asp-tRNA(Asn)/Glu-tRNA(Gln) amidotransferase subunit GatB [Oscillospiraceae bacterium]|jgi:aspartyl-tRNA(Asn)/glutamyl-tRNA(Gln) amidotransferase subunit B|nr:Asp-tRNA(Asn)/Glu-tRNA(Gln) amidotransferase subunit GatB [Oscillospiraceae bacterium]